MTNIDRRQAALERYYEKPSICRSCGEIIRVADGQPPAETRRKKFCGSACAARFNRNRAGTGSGKPCLHCGKPTARPQQATCSLRCHHEHRHKDYIGKWKAGLVDGVINRRQMALSDHIRRYIFEKYDNQCAKCGWDKVNLFTKGDRPALTIDHIDGDSSNTAEENLMLLCPNCHSLTPTYGILNRGHGRRFSYGQSLGRMV